MNGIGNTINNIVNQTCGDQFMWYINFESLLYT